MKTITYKKITSLLTVNLMLGASILVFNTNALARSNTKMDRMETSARNKIVQLQKLMKQAQSKHLDIEREKATLWFANQFLHFANYDQQHIKDHISLFKAYKPLEKDATKLGKSLPHFERSDVVKMLDSSINTMKQVVSGKIVRKPVNKVDWTNIKIKNGQLYNGNNNRPVFLYHYIVWGGGQPGHDYANLYNDYLGNMASPPSILLTLLNNEHGTPIKNKHRKLTKNGKPLYNMDSIINYEKNYPYMKDRISNMILLHGSESGNTMIPKWALDKYGKSQLLHMSSMFTAYDTDNPNIRKMWTTLFNKLIPKLKGKNFTKLGYILANEPHWFVDTKSWGTIKNGMSQYTLAKFQTWLKNKHHNDIHELNTLWHTSYKSFSQVNLKVPFDVKKYNGTPLLYDWSRFSMSRVNNWFQFLNDGIKRNDPNAHTHIKISSVFADIDSVRTNGIDPESLTNMTDFIGNDAKIRKDDPYDEKFNVYNKKYAYYWRDVAMSYALYNSFGPNKINFNSESHFVSASRYRDLYMTPQYVRSSYWLSTVLGMNANRTWYWARNGDGSLQSGLIKPKSFTKKWFPATNPEMPRATNEYLQTMYDLNANSEDIAKLQRQAMPIRVFYSETTSINRQEHIGETYHMFEKLYFNGLPIGFATQKILNNKSHNINNKNFDDLVIYKTTNATQEEFKAVQNYLNNGGTVIIDKESFTLDEYNRPLHKTLTQGKGKLIHITDNTLTNMAKPTMSHVKSAHMPAISLTQHNSIHQKGVIWRVITKKDNSKILTAINVGKTTATINLSNSHTIKGHTHKLKIKNLLTGQPLSSNIKLQSEGILLLEIK